ncbi:TldD/PmbA family protein [bacterium]|nr:TldD/PmbA family protein [bacterium]
MISIEETKNIADKILSFSDADESEIIFYGGKQALTRFSEDRIHQNVAEERIWLSYRSVYGKKTAKISTNRFDLDSLKSLIKDCKVAALNSTEDPDLLPVLEPQVYKEVNAFDESTAHMTPQDRAKVVEEVMALCQKEKLEAFGFFSNTVGNARSQEDFRHFAIANSKGLFSYFYASRGNLSVTVRKNSHYGWAQANSPDLSKISPIDVVSRAAGNIIDYQHRKEIKPGKYTAILSSQAVSNFMIFLMNCFNAMAVDEGRSIFREKLNKKVMSEIITIRDDPYHPLHQGIPFDCEGVPTKDINLVDKGVLAGYVFDRKTAQNHNIEPTGHGEPVPNQIGAFPHYIVVDGSENKPDELIRSTDYGILVNRIWYVRYIDPFNAIVTGLTRDGTYLIEEGKIVSSVRDFRFNQNLIEMFNKVDMTSLVRKTGVFVTPAIKVQDFNFSSYSGLPD